MDVGQTLELWVPGAATRTFTVCGLFRSGIVHLDEAGFTDVRPVARRLGYVTVFRMTRPA